MKIHLIINKLAILLCLTPLIGCEKEYVFEIPKLNTPKVESIDIYDDGFTVFWSEIEGAEYYRVQHLQDINETTDTYYSFSYKDLIKGETEVTVRFQACGSGYKDSDFCKAVVSLDEDIWPTSGYCNGYEWVDLGLSVKWAKCNVGATSEEDYGDYFAWGETTPKTYYGDNNYKYSHDKNGNGRYEDNEYEIIGNISGTKYDAAQVNMGYPWRLPTIEEWKELYSKCQCKRSSGKITGPNGESMFLPNAGFREEESLKIDEHKLVHWVYWSSTPSPHSDQQALTFDLGTWLIGFEDRYLGIPIRAVCDFE